MYESELFSGWEIVGNSIGKGGFSKVYKIRKADDLGGEFFSALKVISIPYDETDYNTYKDEGHDDESISKIFRAQAQSIVNEFKLLSELRGNTNIVSYEDHKVVQQPDGYSWHIFIRMELLTPLTTAYNQKPLTVTDIVKLGIDICNALEICESNNIVHRDIKPQNIFVNKRGDYKLGDFGIAKSMEHTTRATKIGTPAYMAPEVFNLSAYNSNVDIYSLGMVLYWLLNERRLPFLPLPPEIPTDEMNHEAQIRRLKGEPLPEPKNGTPSLKNAVLTACSFEPKNRFQNASAFKKALTNVLSDIQSTNFPPIIPPLTSLDTEKDATVKVRKNTQYMDEQSIVSTNNKIDVVRPLNNNTSTSDNDAYTPSPAKKKSKALLAALLTFISVMLLGIGIFTAYTFLENDEGVASDELITSELDNYNSFDNSISNSKDYSTYYSEEDSMSKNSDGLESFDTLYSGITNSGLDWEIYSNGTLIISGVGAMNDYLYSTPEWFPYKDYIINVVIKNGVTKIGNYSLSRCTNIQTITLSDSVTTIGDYAFYDCDALSYINIPKHVTSIGKYALYNCDSLISVNVDEQNTVFTSDDGILINKANATLVCCPRNKTGSYTIPNYITKIENYSFESCEKIQGINIPDSVTNIGNSAFYNCSSITEIIIPSSVTSIGEHAFYECNRLRKIVINIGVTNIGANAFLSCDSLNNVIYAGTRSQWNAIPKGTGWDKDCPFTEVTFLTFEETSDEPSAEDDSGEDSC